MLPFLFAHIPAVSANEVDAQQLHQIGMRVFDNECRQQLACLTSWNKGEEFASMGIGHFIWYPDNTAPEQKRFDESFPKLMLWMKQQGLQPPQPALAACPWPDRASFLQAQDSADMRVLRDFLVSHMDAQVRFMKQRLDNALSKMKLGLSDDQQTHLQQRYQQIMDTPMGLYVLLDYVNFKGEGTKASERYQGKGWGLKQVLLNMRDQPDSIDAFILSARQILEQRVHLSPPERNEQRWLAGWNKRLETYRQLREEP